MIVKTYHDDGAASDYESDNFILHAIDDSGNKKTFSIGSGEPEDMYLFRNLSDALDVPELMEMAYNAGKNGESFKIVSVEKEEEL